MVFSLLQGGHNRHHHGPTLSAVALDERTLALESAT